MRCMSVGVHCIVDDPVVFDHSRIPLGVPGEHVLYVCSCRRIPVHPIVEVVVHVLERHLVPELVLVPHESRESLGNVSHAP